MPVPHRPAHTGPEHRPLAVLLAAALLATAVLAPACGGKKPGERSRPVSPTGGGVESGLVDAGRPVRGGKIVYAIEAETSGGFCLPEAQLAISGMMVVRAIYDTLTVPNAKGVYVPYLAKKLSHNADYTSWDITVRDGVKFHDGSKLDAKVVKNNLDAYRGKYPGRASLLGTFVLGNIDTITATGPMTLQVRTKKPWIAFPAYLYGGSRFGIMAQAQLDDQRSCDRKLIGTGPFVFKSWTPNQKLEAVRNADYWQIAPDGKPYPYADSIELRPITEGPQRINSLESGTINVMHSSSPADIGGALTDLRKRGVVNTLASQEHAEVGYLLLNASKPPFDDIRMRRALAMAVDRRQVNDVLADGLPTIADGPFAPGTSAYLSKPGFPRFDPAGARKLIADYVRDGGKAEIVLTLAAGTAVARLGELLQQQAKKAGLRVRLVAEDQAKLINDAIGGAFQALTFRNHPGGDPDTQYVWWYDGNPDPKAVANPVNFGRINDPLIDRLLDQGRSEPDPAKRARIYQDLNREFARKVWNVWLSYTIWAIAESSDVHGVLGPDLPDGGGKPFTGLATGHPLLGMWIEKR